MNKNKILVVDDDANICELVRLHLVKEGFETAISYDGEDALKKFRTEEPCLVILDLMLSADSENSVKETLIAWLQNKSSENEIEQRISIFLNISIENNFFKRIKLV